MERGSTNRGSPSLFLENRYATQWATLESVPITSVTP
jgi:hypothetical protein